MSALSILITAPLGAALMDILGQRLLKKEQAYVQITEQDECYRIRNIPVIQTSGDYGSCSRVESRTLKSHSGA